MNNLDIFVCAHKSVNLHVKNESYKLLSVGNNSELHGDNIYRDDSGDNISNLNGFYCELTGLYWLWKNYQLKDWVGICHYRRFFDFIENVPNMDEEDCDVMLATPLQVSAPLYKQYSICHNSKDMDVINNLLFSKYNVPIDVINDVFFNQTYLYPCNMFIMRKEHFKEYCSFIFNILQDLLNTYKLNTMEDIVNHVENNKKNYLKSFYPNNTVEYQSRFGGFLSERLLNLWIKCKGLKIKTCNIIETESKYINDDKKVAVCCR